MALLFALIHQENFMGTSRNKGSKVKNTNHIPLFFGGGGLITKNSIKIKVIMIW